MNKWKVTAIIVIVLLVLETLFMIWAYNIGTTAIEQETKCSNDICFYFDAYQLYDNTCYCYTGNEIAYTKYLG